MLTLGSAGTHLKLTDSNETLSLNNLALETGAGSLTLAGPLSLSNNGQLNSTAGTITLSSGGSAASGATVSIPGSTLVLQSGLSLSGSTLKASGTTFTTNNNTIALNGSILEVQGTQDLTGVVPNTSSTLRLGANATINDSSVLSVGTLDLANFALTLNDQMAGLTVGQAVTLDAATEQIISGDADLSLGGGITVSNGILSSTGGTLSASGFSAGAAAKVNILGGTLILPAGGTAVSGAAITTSNAAISLTGTLAVADTLTSTSTNLSLTGDAILSSTAPVSLATLSTNGKDFKLANGTTDLTLANNFTLSSGKLSTQGGDLIFTGSSNISSGAILDATVATGTAGKLEFKQGGTASGTINAGNGTFKLGANYAVDGTLITGSGTTWQLGTSDLDLSAGALVLGGNVVLDNVITNNQTRFELAEDATVTRNAGFTLGGINFANKTFTLGSATTDMTLVDNSSSNSSNSSPPGTFATKLADLTFISSGAANITTGTTITSTGGTFSFAKGIKMNGATISLTDTTLAIGDNLTKTGGTLTLNQADLELTSDLAITSDAAMAFDNLLLENNHLNLLSAPSFTAVHQQPGVCLTAPTGVPDIFHVSSLPAKRACQMRTIRGPPHGDAEEHRHKHVPEMELYSGFRVNFTPVVLHTVFVGINSNIRIELSDKLRGVPEDEAVSELQSAIRGTYGPDDLVAVVADRSAKLWGTADAVGTHALLIKVRVDEGFAYINALEDNLGKGAASQGVENMNLMLGYDRLYGIDAVYRTSHGADGEDRHAEYS